jgi:16S rRNA processing protein RimM
MGRIGAPYGIRGWLKVHSYTDPPENLLHYSPWWIRWQEEWRALRVMDGRRHGKGLVAQVAGYEDREAARVLVGAEVAIERGHLQAPGEGEYYWADLVGLPVFNREGVRLGEVDHLVDNGAQDVLVLRGGEKERLIPFVPGYYVLQVDLEQGRMVVDWDKDD